MKLRLEKKEEKSKVALEGRRRRRRRVILGRINEIETGGSGFFS